MFIGGERGELDRHAPAQVRVFGQINLTHAALTEVVDDSIMRNYLPNHWPGLVNG